MPKKALLLLLLLASSSFAWWDASFPYRTQVNISNSGSALTDYQVSITLNTQALVSAGKMRTDCGDLRAVASNDSSQLSHWIESGCNTSMTKIWVKVPSIPSGTSTIYAYYGNLSAAYNNALGGNSTFDAFDLTSFTEYDPSGHLTVNNATKVSWSGNMYQSTSYLYHPISLRSDVLADFEYQDTSSQTIAIGFADSIGAVKQVTNGIYAVTYTPGGARGFYIDHATSGTIASSSSYIPYGASLYYGRFTRIGTTVTLHLFSDAARTAEISGSPITYTDASVAPVNLVYAISGRAESSGGFAMVGYVQNFRVRKYASPEPTTNTLNEEEALKFTYRKDIQINNTGSALTDYQLNLTINTTALITAGKMKSDCSDIRFTNATSYNTQDWAVSYKYWIESGCNTSATKIWVKAAAIPTGASTIYAYYGNASAASASNGTNTFIDFSDFDDLTGWTQQSGTWTVSSGALLTHQTVEQANTLRRDTALPAPPYMASFRTRVTVERYNSARGILFEANNPIVGATNIMWVANTQTDRFYNSVDADWAGTLVTLDANTWYIGNLLVKSGDNIATIYSDNRASLIATKTNTLNSAGTGHFYGFIMYASDADMEFDWVFVRKYASPEPTASAGTEQQPDTIPPAVSIQAPANTTYASSAVPVNFTATDDTGLSSCTVKLNGTINSSTCDNYTLTLANGAYTLNISANDPTGNTNSSQVSFTAAIPSGAQSNSTSATTDANGMAAGNLSFSFTPGTLKINTGTQEQTKALRASAGVSRIEIKAKVTLSGQAAAGKRITYTISE